MKRKALALTIILAFSFFIAGGLQFVKFAEANPYPIKFVRVGEGSPPAGTKPIPVLISSPKNNTVYASNNVSLTFNASVSEYYGEIYYTASWQQSKKTYIKLNSPKYNPPQFSINITDIPEGPRWLEVYAVQEGRQITREECDSIFSTIYYLSYEITGSSMVNFTIDTTAPKISLLSVENKTYTTPDITLDFTVNEAFSKVTYSLDGQDNVTIAENALLTGLTNGDHNVTVYATDEAGNIGRSETVYFSVDVHFPTTLIIATVVTVAVVGVGLLVYFKKRQRSQNP
jgi:hypothetical protein